ARACWHRIVMTSDNEPAPARRRSRDDVSRLAGVRSRLDCKLNSHLSSIQRLEKGAAVFLRDARGRDPAGVAQLPCERPRLTVVHDDANGAGRGSVGPLPGELDAAPLDKDDAASRARGKLLRKAASR